MSYKPLTKEQYQKAINAGFKHQEIVDNEVRRKNMIEGRADKIKRYQAETDIIKQEATKKGSIGGLFKETLKGIPKATVEVGLGTPAKFVTSALEAPRAAITGKASQKTYDLPGLDPFKSYQSEAETRASNIIEGEQSLASAITPFISVPLAGLETMFLGGLVKKGITKGVSAVGKIGAKRELGRLAETIAPAVTKKTSIDAFQKAGKPGGAKLKGLFKTKITRQPSKQDLEAAKLVKGVVKSKSSPVRNIIRVNEKIEKTSNDVVSFLRTAKTNSKYTSKNLSRALDNIKPSLTTKSDVTLNRTFNNIKKLVKDVALKNADDNQRLWEARIKLDNIMEGEFNKIFGNPEKYTSTKDAYLQMRRAINDFIKVRTVGGEKFTKGMKELSQLYEVRLNLAEKNYKLMNTTWFKRFLKIHPNVRRVLWYGGAGVAGAMGVKILD